MKNAAKPSVFSYIVIFSLVMVVAVIFRAQRKAAPENESVERVGIERLEKVDQTGVLKGEVPVAKKDRSKVMTAEHRGAKESPVVMVSLADFTELTQKTQSQLPTLKNLRGLSASEVHGVPEIIQQAGHKLGVIAQALHDNPQLASEAAAFYKNCFHRKDIPVQVRGLCLANHRNLRISHGDRVDWTEQELEAPREVLSLASMIPLSY